MLETAKRRVGLMSIVSAAVFGAAALSLGTSRPARATVCDAVPATAAYMKVSSIPIARAASLPAGGSAPVHVVANDSAGNCVAGATVYLFFTGAGAAYPGTVARCQVGNGGSLTPNWAACTTDANGAVDVVFTTPSILPNGGNARISAAATIPIPGTNPSASGMVTTEYAYLSVQVAASSGSAVEGSTFSGTVGTFTTNFVPPSGILSASIAWGDGSTSAGSVVPMAIGTAFAVAGSHTYAEENLPGTAGYATAVTVSVLSGPSSSAAGQMSVADAPITATGVKVRAKARKPFTAVVANFSDSDPAGMVADYAATVSWGDGTSSTGTISPSAGGFTVTGSHAYAKRATYAVSARVADVGGAVATASSSVTAG